MSAASNFLENTLVDVLLRGQSATINGKTLSWSAAPTYYAALYTAAPSDAGGGTEVAAGDYARVAVACSLANWSGTQAAASTTASSGTGGRSSNNAAISFTAAAGSAWGTITHVALFDAATSGNLVAWVALTAPKTINAGDPVSFPADALGWTFA